MTIEVKINENENILLTPLKKNEDIFNPEYKLLNLEGGDKEWITVRKEGNHLVILSKDSQITENDEDLQAKLDQLVLDLIEAEQSGIENSEPEFEYKENPYNPDEIKVSAKQFSLKLIKDMIDGNDLDLNPDFQRNFVWNSLQKSRLIESILLRIPLPMFYFSEDGEGRLMVIDGLQRLTTINEFMNNKFPLQGLEYLKETCENRYYKEENGKSGLDAKYLRWFNLTQISGNVIDPSSPFKVKYDIFRRINTGGKPLNNQEIRNCLSGKVLRETLKKMVTLPEFKEATDYSLKPTRMDDQEIALRFILFSKLYEEDQKLDNYTGYMDRSLDNLTEDLKNIKEPELEKYIYLFSNAMKNARYLFGPRYAFRKIKPEHLKPNAHKQLINKALFVSWSALLSKYDPDKIEESNREGSMAAQLADEIDTDAVFLYYLSTGTNGKINIQTSFFKAENLIKKYLKD